MTDSRLSPIAPRHALTAVAGRILHDLDDLVDRLGQAYRDEVPEYAALTPAEMATEVLPVSRTIVEAFFSRIAEGKQPDGRELARVSDMGRRRLEMGIPLEPMLHVYRIAGRVVWDAVVTATRPGEEAVLAELGSAWIDYTDRAASLAAASYLAASHQRLRTVDARRRALLDALLSATDAAEVAAVSVRFSIVLAAAYVPVLVEGEQASAGIDAMLAAAPTGTIGGPHRGRVLLLVPAPVADMNPVWRAGGRPLLAWGQPAAPGPDLLAEVGQTETLVAAALAGGHTTGVFGPDDLLLDQLLVGNERAAAAVRRRVKELTGLDPRVPAEAALLVLALRPTP